MSSPMRNTYRSCRPSNHQILSEILQAKTTNLMQQKILNFQFSFWQHVSDENHLDQCKETLYFILTFEFKLANMHRSKQLQDSPLKASKPHTILRDYM